METFGVRPVAGKNHGSAIPPKPHSSSSTRAAQCSVAKNVAHCGLPWSDACLSFHETERPVRTASATQVRQPIYRTSLGRWRVYEEFLDPLLTALGPVAS